MTCPAWPGVQAVVFTRHRPVWNLIIQGVEIFIVELKVKEIRIGLEVLWICAFRQCYEALLHDPLQCDLDRALGVLLCNLTKPTMKCIAGEYAWIETTRLPEVEFGFAGKRGVSLDGHVVLLCMRHVSTPVWSSTKMILNLMDVGQDLKSSILQAEIVTFFSVIGHTDGTSLPCLVKVNHRPPLVLDQGAH